MSNILNVLNILTYYYNIFTMLRILLSIFYRWRKRERFGYLSNNIGLMSLRTRILIQTCPNTYKHTEIPWLSKTNCSYVFYCTFQVYFYLQDIFYTLQFISICIMLHKIHIYFIITKLHLINSTLQRKFVILVWATVV